MKYKNLTVITIALLFVMGVQAQQNHFVYIQTDNRQPFYVKLDKKIYSSSSSGYLIMGKLVSGVYNFTIGFPKNEFPEQQIDVQLDNNDLGYLLKNFGQNGWGLFNLQSLAVSMANQTQKVAPPAKEVKSDAFSTMLSQVVDDPSVKEKDIAKEIKKKDANPVVPVTVPIIKGTVAIEKKMPAADTVKSDSLNTKRIVAIQIKGTKINVDTNAIIKNDEGKVLKIKAGNTIGSGVQKLNLHKDSLLSIAYLDTAEGASDTIKIYMDRPLVTPEAKIIKQDAPVALTAEVSAVSKKDTMPKEEFLKMDMADKTVKSLIADSAVKSPAADNAGKTPNADSAIKPIMSKSPMINSDCKNFAAEDDFLKLRKKMAASESGDGMIAIAKKVFKTRCFTTEQVKNLSVLFLKDADKYNFFDAAYPFVSDSHNYPSLQSQLTDNYYLDRFKAMIRH